MIAEHHEAPLCVLTELLFGAYRPSKMQALSAKTWVIHADSATDAVSRYASYDDAIPAYRGASAKSPAVTGVDPAPQAGRDATGEMAMISTPETDLTDVAEAAANRIRHPEPPSALFPLCSLHRLPSKAKYTQGAVAVLNDAVLLRMLDFAAPRGRWRSG